MLKIKVEAQSDVSSDVWNAIRFEARQMRNIALVQKVVCVKAKVKFGFSEGNGASET